MWRLLDERIDPAHLPGVRAARAAARARVWAAGAAPTPGGWLHLDLDATISIDHCDNKENAAATWKRRFGYHPAAGFLDRRAIAGGEALAGLLRPGNAGSNTVVDHITVLIQALESLPRIGSRIPKTRSGPKLVIRSDSAAAIHRFALACRGAGVGFCFGLPVDARVQAAAETLDQDRSLVSGHRLQR